LCNQRYEVFRPKIRLRRRSGGRLCQVVESMFPRYLFVRLDRLATDWAPIRSTRGVVGLVRWGANTPPVPGSVIEDLRQRTGDDECIDMVSPGYRRHERVRITEGVFAGYEAVFDARNGDERVSVLLDIMRRAQRLVLPEQAIEKA
jgi:transcriptional antiterminator RfaH